MRWGFIRKVYGILSAQLLFTSVVVAVMILNAPVRSFVMTSQPFIWVALLLPFISECSEITASLHLCFFIQKHLSYLVRGARTLSWIHSRGCSF